MSKGREKEFDVAEEVRWGCLYLIRRIGRRVSPVVQHVTIYLQTAGIHNPPILK